MEYKKFYVTIEVDAQITDSLCRNTKENRQVWRDKLNTYLYNRKTKTDYDFYIYGENTLTIIDDKGREL